MDFDGTLAPIVGEPREARPLPGIPDLLAALSARWGAVAVLSGRPVTFLAEHLAGAGTTRLYGLYGMEEATASYGEVGVAPEAESWRSVVTAAADQAEAAAPPGVAVERKGLAFTLHYRSVPERGSEADRLAAGIAAGSGLVAHAGKMSVELRPPVEVDKGTVLERLSVGLRSVLFAGDDIGDLPAFAALDRLRAAGILSLSVAAGGQETPAALLAAADVVVAGPEGVRDTLERLAG